MTNITESENSLALYHWQAEIQQNIFQKNHNFEHTVNYYFGNNNELLQQLNEFGAIIPTTLENLVVENHKDQNLPKIQNFDSFGQAIEKLIHHPNYAQIGDLIYQTQLLKYFSEPGGILKSMLFAYLSAHLGEAGHNCPIACSAGLVRILKKYPQIKNSAFFLEKLLTPSYTQGFSAAQFLTEIQGGSDLSSNEVYANLDAEGEFHRIYGDKWFCSNANADLFLLTARYDRKIPGTKGLGLFLVPARVNDQANQFQLKRLKNKLGTQTLATAEINFNGSIAYAVGPVNQGIKIVLENVLNVSRMFNAVIVTGMTNRAWQIANAYSKHRAAFGQTINQYPLVQENLSRIQAENLALTASVFKTIQMQDDVDLGKITDEKQILVLRLLINMNKYITALMSFDHIHHAIDTLAGNGVIESFSALPRLLRDCIICENWEGTHNTLRMQILRDMHKYHVEQPFCELIETQLTYFTDHPQTQAIQKSFAVLKDNLTIFNKLNPTKQSLKIKGMIDQMIKLFSAVTLLAEATHQQQTQNANTKLNALKLFCHLHLNAQIDDDEYLHLIRELTLSNDNF
ncbi:MAG: acyl-CoA dehydrogenase family protein [Pseudomonadota bacterium]